MTLGNREWLLAQTRRLSLDGLTQEEIANELNISEGSVNAVIQELIASDDTLKLEHEIAVVSKKTGVSVKELASNMAFSNAIKKLAYESGKIEPVLAAVNRLCTEDGSLEPDAIAHLFIRFCDFTYKEDVPPDALNDQLKEKYEESDRLDKELDASKIQLDQSQHSLNKELEKYNVTLQELYSFRKFREDMEEFGFDINKREEILNTLYVLWEMDNDPKRIMNEIKVIRPLRLEKMRLEDECKKIAAVLDSYRNKKREQKMYWASYDSSIQLWNNLLQKQSNPHDVLKLVEVAQKYGPDLSLDELAKEIDTYGGIQAAIFKKFNDYKEQCSAAQNIDSSVAV